MVRPTAWPRARGRGRRAVIASPISTMPPSVASDAPPISIRWVGPQSVTSWPNSRCQMSSSGKPREREGAAGGHHQAADRRPPVRRRGGSRSSRGAPCRTAPSTARRPRARRRGRQNQIVGRVGERARVAPVVDVERDVPVHAEHRDEQRALRAASTAPPPRPGSPVWRSAQLADRSEPARCARCGGRAIRSATSAVATSAPAVAPIASPSAAPPAGSLPVDCANGRRGVRERNAENGCQQQSRHAACA